MASFLISGAEIAEELSKLPPKIPPAPPPEVKAIINRTNATPTATTNAPSGIERSLIRFRNAFSLVLLRRRSDRDSDTGVTIFGSAAAASAISLLGKGFGGGESTGGVGEIGGAIDALNGDGEICVGRGDRGGDEMGDGGLTNGRNGRVAIVGAGRLIGSGGNGETAADLPAVFHDGGGTKRGEASGAVNARATPPGRKVERAEPFLTVDLRAVTFLAAGFFTTRLTGFFATFLAVFLTAFLTAVFFARFCATYSFYNVAERSRNNQS